MPTGFYGMYRTDSEGCWSATKELVVSIPLAKQLPPGVMVCFRCGGTGTGEGGSCSFSEREIRIKPAPPCHLCRGERYVRVESYNPDEQLAKSGGE